MKDNSTEGFDSLYAKKNNGLKIAAIVFIAVILIFISVYSYLSIGAVRHRMEQEKSQVSAEAAVNPALIGLMKDKAWVESRLKMAAYDSIGLSIDLEERVVQLELKGVVVMKSKIRDYSTSGFFKRMDGNVYFSMFGSPLTILHFDSSIAKNPFKVIQAPKNEEEADANAMKKDSAKIESVYWTVKLDQDIELNIQGIDSISDSNYKLGKGFTFKRDLKNMFQSMKQVIQFKRPVYTPEILISIPENDAKAILRALPRKAMVTIRI